MPNNHSGPLANIRPASRSDSMNKRRQDRGEELFGPALLAAAVVFSLSSVDFSVPPSEDAAMLMRYSHHLASGAGIVWNIDEPPVDGATDFLFMVVVAGLVRAGTTLESAVLAIGLLSHVATIVTVYWVLVRNYRIPFLVSAFFALWLAIGPGRGYVSSYFGTTFFAMLGAIAGLFFLRALRHPVPSNAAGFAISCLLLGLDRPEGVFLSGFMLAGLVVWHGWGQSKAILFAFALAVGLVGGMYFAWHWAYFGYPLPNPFYKKGGGFLYLQGLRISLMSTFIFLLPVWPIFALGLLQRETARRTAIVLMPILGFTGIWILLSDEMNWLGRFQYAVMPLGLMAWPEAMPSRLYERLAALANRWRRIDYSAWAFGLASVVILVIVAQTWSKHITVHRDGRFTVAGRLSELQDRGYVLAATEAGLLPLYSGWKALDIWGLNDQWIAHNGIVSAEYLDRYRPHVLMVHDHADSKLANWSQMVEVLKDYVARRNYVLAAAWGDPSADDTHCYFVRADFLDSDRVVQLIRETEYIWPKSVKPAFNYALDPNYRCN